MSFDFLQNEFVISNLVLVGSAFLIAFLISLLFAPLAGKLAWKFGAIDLPSHLRSGKDKTASRRIHSETIPKWGGLAIVVGIIGAILLTGSFQILSPGIIIGFIIIVILGLLDDKYELGGTTQLFFQFLAAAAVVLGGVSITSIGFLGSAIDLSVYSGLLEIGNFTYFFNLPGDIFTIIWIMAMMNIVNWVGGLDGLNISVSSIAAFTILIFALDSANIALATIIAMHIGGNLGLLPYNYNPAKIFPLSLGDYVNGYLLAVFAILGSTRWTFTIILLALPIIDALLVIIVRFKSHPEILLKPWKILHISDKNHLHHRLLDVGYSKKMVLFFEVALMVLICSIAVYFGLQDSRPTFAAVTVAGAVIFSAFVIIAFLKARTSKNRLRAKLLVEEEPQKEVEVKVVVKDEEEDEEYDKRYVY